jgi:hypothetical protein
MTWAEILPPGARPVVDDDGAAERLGHVVGDDAGIGIDRAARRQSHDEAHRR